MSRVSIAFGRRPALASGTSAADRGTHGSPWRHYSAALAAELESVAPRHGCAVIRRITDDLGREWRVRQLWSENCHGLLFQCAVPGVRSEVRPMRAALESLTDNELTFALMPTDD